jgi:hypothetical protein
MLTSGVKLVFQQSWVSGNVDDRTGHVSDFEIVTIDVVAQPSAPNAYPTAIYEGLMNMKYGHRLLEVAREAGADNKVQRYLKSEVVKTDQRSQNLGRISMLDAIKPVTR